MASARTPRSQNSRRSAGKGFTLRGFSRERKTNDAAPFGLGRSSHVSVAPRARTSWERKP